MDADLNDAGGVGAGNRAVAAVGRPKGNARISACFGLLLFIYVFSAFRVGPVGFLGKYEDDTIYFSAAKALASGQGYILPSFPIPLKITKYPELYPLVLAGIWKIDPHFPGNVDLAVGLTLAFGCAGLLFAFLLLRRWPGMGDWPALLAIALCAFTGHFLEISVARAPREIGCGQPKFPEKARSLGRRTR